MYFRVAHLLIAGAPCALRAQSMEVSLMELSAAELRVLAPAGDLPIVMDLRYICSVITFRIYSNRQRFIFQNVMTELITSNNFY